jgi:predicted pyridoxine 5'-phosphate oxidase superfamily flavin-nucleotide-binding protein
MDFLTSREALRTHYRAPSDGPVRKELKRLDHHCRNFIAKSPFVLIGSSDRDGNADVTPKGDKPGFAAILDDNTIAIPDRPGNNRLDTLENIVVNPAVGLLFLIPNMNETLRVHGRRKRARTPGGGRQAAHVGDHGHGEGLLHALRQGLPQVGAVEPVELAGARGHANAGRDHEGPARFGEVGRGGRQGARRRLRQEHVVGRPKPSAA